MATDKSLNVAVLGHVDSGKTTLAKALSSMGSTAAFDKHAKSANLRANTIDLGYSTLRIGDAVIALIDCPGHASLIRLIFPCFFSRKSACGVIASVVHLQNRPSRLRSVVPPHSSLSLVVMYSVTESPRIWFV